MDEWNWYTIGVTIVGFLVFLGVWGYAIMSWGFLIGIAFGWFPAMIVAGIAGALWPIVILAIIGLIFLISGA